MAEQAKQRRPYKTGEIIGTVPKNKADSPSLTEFERSVLEGSGWKPGEKLPDLTNTAFGQRAKQHADNIRKQAEEQIKGKAPVPADTPPAKAPPTRDISEVHPAERMEIENLLKEQGLPEQSVVEDGGTQIVNDLSTRFNPLKDARTPQKPDTAAPEPDTDSDKANATVQQDETQKLCERCGHILGAPLVDVTDEDKQNYIQTILGGIRFRKTYEAYGGRLKFTFRSLSPLESNMAFDQADNDTASSKISTGLQYMRRLEDYRLVSAIESLERLGKSPTQFAEVGNLEYDSDVFNTPLPQLVEFMHEKIFVSDHVRRTIGQFWAGFQRLLETLEAKARDPDFFDETGP